MKNQKGHSLITLMQHEEVSNGGPVVQHMYLTDLFWFSFLHNVQYLKEKRVRNTSVSSQNNPDT